MNQHTRDFFSGYRQMIRTVIRLLLYRQVAIRRLISVPVNLFACLLNRPPPLPPTVLQIDITNICNLKCPGCLTTLGLHKHQQGMMARDHFLRLIDEAGRFTALAVLYNSGEPLLHPEAVDMIGRLTRNRIASIISTNGHFVKTPEEAEALVASGLSVLVVSLSGATQQVYEQYHRGGTLSQVVRGVQYVMAVRKKLKKKKPLIILRFLVMDHNRHEKKAMADLAGKAGCDWFEFREVNWRACLVSSPGVPPPRDDQLPVRRKTKICLWPWLITVVNWDGVVYPCCFYSLNLPDMGNAIDGNGIQAVWKSEAYNLFRRRMRTGTGLPAACRDCPAEIGFQTRFSRQRRTVRVYRDETRDPS